MTTSSGSTAWRKSKVSRAPRCCARRWRPIRHNPSHRATFKSQSEPSSSKDWLDQAFGIWKDRTDIGDSVEWQRRERASWTRPWDDDYEDVKTEFPDLFDEWDDRERKRYLDMVAGKRPNEKPTDP